MLLVEIDLHGPVALLPLARIMVMDRATLGHNLRPLEALGCIRLAVGADRRSREVTITPAGRRMLQTARPMWERAQAIFEARFGKEDAARLRATLHGIAGMEFTAVLTDS